MNRLNAGLRVSKNTSMLFLGTASRMFLSFGYVVVIARYLGVTGFGKYALAQRYFELFLGLSATGVTLLITREIARRPERTNAYLSASVVQVAGLAGLGVVATALIAGLLGYAADTQAAILIAAAALVPAALSLVMEAIFVAYETAEYVTYGTIVESVLRMGLGLLFLWLGFGLLSLFVALVIARIVVVLLYLILLRRIRDVRWEFSWVFLRQLLRDWRIFAVENWTSTLYSNLGIILLSFFHSEAVVGLFAAAGKLLRLGSVVAKSYTTAVYPYLSRVFVDSKENFRRVSLGSLRYMVALVLPVTLTIFILSEPIIRIVYGDEFLDAVPMLQALVWVLLLNFFNPYLSHVLFAREAQRDSLRIAVVKLSVYVVIALLLIPSGGGVGAAWARLFSAAVAFSAYFLAVVKGENVLRTLWLMGRATPPAIVLGLFFLLQPQAHPVPLVAAGGVIYIVLLFLLRVVSWQEINALLRLK